MQFYLRVHSFMSLLILFLAFTLLSPHNQATAQGWTFTFQLAQSGPCGANVPLLPTFPNLQLPTKDQCESLKKMILDVKASSAVYGDHGQIIGYCTVFYTASACTGSDIVSTSTITGEVSMNSIVEGKPIFTPHSSQAFEDWAKDYKALLESYGITSILGKTISTLNIPTVGNKKQNSFYKKEADDFNPDIPEDHPLPQDANVVDLSKTEKKYGTVDLLRSPEDIAKEEKWYTDNGFRDFNNINNNEIDPGSAENAEMSIGEALVRNAVTSAPGLEGIFGNFGINMIDEEFKGLNKVTSQLGNIDQAAETANELPKNMLINSGKKTLVDAATGFVSDKTFGPVLDLVKGAGTVHTVINFGIDVWNTHKGQ